MKSDAVSNAFNAVNANNTADDVADNSEALQISQFPDDILPPEGIYESREALFAAANAWAKPRGYAFTTGKSKKTKNGRTKVVVACDRTQAPPNPSTVRKRRTSSRGTSCKFSVLAKESADDGSWTLTHRPGSEFAQHNHPPSDDASAHPIHRALRKEDITIISDLVAAGVASRCIKTYLYNKSDTLATAKDIENQISAAKRDLGLGQSSSTSSTKKASGRCQDRVIQKTV
ncbi:mutator-like element transposase [Ceratocystis lukuohia]|uniref:Mutator-like element transposase n=1 Tax=Ceratocystis lukuohia TaxID=2019550 RepID=A0ABR4ML87_9PEZI